MHNIQVGGYLNGATLDALPPTSRVNYGGARYVRHLNGKWVQIDRPEHVYKSSDLGRVRVEYLPPDAVLVESEETFDEWAQRFYTAVDGAAREHSVSRDDLTASYAKIGITPPEGGLPPGFRGGGARPLGAAPIGTLVRVKGGSVWKNDDAGWVIVAPTTNGGRFTRVSGRWTVIRWGIDGPTAVPDSKSPSTDERRRLRIAKAKAWKVAMTMKARRGWCDTLERIIGDGGVTELDAETGLRITNHEQARLPERTVLWWQSGEDQDRWQLLVRDDSQSNTSRTRSLLNHSPHLRASRQVAEVAWLPGDEDMFILLPPAPFAETVALLPLGWRLVCEGSNYTITEVGVEHASGSIYQARDFRGEGRIGITSIPGVNQ